MSLREPQPQSGTIFCTLQDTEHLGNAAERLSSCIHQDREEPAGRTWG